MLLKTSKKLACVLGLSTAVITTSMPIQAAAKMSIVRENMLVAKGTVFEEVATAPQISITFIDAVKTVDGYAPEVFYINITGAEFTDLMFHPSISSELSIKKIEKQDAHVAKVQIVPESTEKEYIIPLLIKMTGDQASLAIETRGSGSTITEVGNTTTVITPTSTNTSEVLPEVNQVPAQGHRKIKISFVIGKAEYTVNNQVKSMDAASYIQNPGYTMVPIRYVAEALGIEADNIKFNGGRVILNTEDKTIELVKGSAVAKVNGKDVQMATEVVIKEGRTYAPIGEISKLLDIHSNWDSSSKTAIFITSIIPTTKPNI